MAADKRRKGYARALLAAAEAWAKARGLTGFMLEAQDVNLAACRAYAKMGFVIGGVDSRLYWNTPQRDDLAVFWYKMFNEEG